MQTITKTFNIYEFDELAEDIKQKVIEREAEGIRQIEIEDFLREEMEFYAEQLLEEYFEDKAIFKNVFYSLSYCQGDGAMIEFDLNYCGKNVEIRHDPHCHYCHERSFEIIDHIGEQLTNLQQQIGIEFEFSCLGINIATFSSQVAPYARANGKIESELSFKVDKDFKPSLTRSPGQVLNAECELGIKSDTSVSLIKNLYKKDFGEKSLVVYRCAGNK